MIKTERTLEQFGYLVESLLLGSHKLVVAICDYCKKEYYPQYKNYLVSIKKNEKIKFNKLSCEQCRQIKRIEIKKYLGTYDKETKLSHQKRIQTLKKTGSFEKMKIKCQETWAQKSQEDIQKIVNQRRQTNKNLYGVEYSLQNQEIKDKAKKTWIKKYGVDNPSLVKEFQEKRRLTMQKRYGVDNISFSQEFINKQKEYTQKAAETKIKRYGTANPNKFGQTEKEIKIWLNSFGLYFENNYSILKNQEIDLYEKNLRLGVEYCGLMWHNENSPNPRLKNYHYDKYKKCLDQEVRLITIFEDEWLQKEQQVKGFLQSILNKNPYVIFARKCDIKLINKQEGNNFYSLYHIQGVSPCVLFAAGLFYDNGLVGVMSFGRHPRDSKKLVLDRLCFKKDFSIPGGASRLFQFLLKETEVKNITSWSDNRWSQGNVYQKLGFNLLKDLPPDYSYVDSRNYKQRISKQSQQKKKTNCPIELTEYQWALERGLYRIWDCGKKVWEYKT